ncbi:hypothetical protein O9929_26490 [Vibrio lentus]|nr:hypothetical protein [Vibrio lentus]
MNKVWFWAEVRSNSPYYSPLEQLDKKPFVHQTIQALPTTESILITMDEETVCSGRKPRVMSKDASHEERGTIPFFVLTTDNKFKLATCKVFGLWFSRAHYSVLEQSLPSRLIIESVLLCKR